ncbi:MAG: biotin--[acetyl-CoA-carboxylase] ligase [Clostridiaceae bacterium]|nr:biotin--[acetyl-CoA-carboxylase] ligase [Clostridiaceae bacterium]
MKEKILKILLENKGEFVSGEKLAKESGITRGGVWKAVKALRDEGYEIEAQTRKGYKLSGSSDVISKEEIEKHLKTKFLGKDIITLKSVDSTNNYLKNLENKRDGLLVVADEQTKGRGRLNRGFYSPKGSGIYMSILLIPKFDPAFVSQITALASVAVLRAVKKYTDGDITIKWVNDLYINGKKFCGILSEANFTMEDFWINYLIVGIGINVKTKDFPKDLKDVAGSLNLNISRCELIAQILNEFETLYEDIGKKTYLDDYKKYQNILGKEIKVIKGNQEFFARAVGIDDEARLIIEHGGMREALSSGEVTIRRV